MLQMTFWVFWMQFGSKVVTKWHKHSQNAMFPYSFSCHISGHHTMNYTVCSNSNQPFHSLSTVSSSSFVDTCDISTSSPNQPSASVMASTILFAGDLTASSSTSAQNPNVETDILADSTLRQSALSLLTFLVGFHHS